MLNDSLWTVCEGLYFPRKLNTGPETRRQYRYALNDWARTLGREPTLADLDDDRLTLWMRAMMDRRPALSPWTINERAGRVKTLWTWLAKKQYVSTFPTVQRLACPEPTPRAWTQEQLAKLFAGADLEGGLIGGVPARLWWKARLAWHWFTGERKGATDALTWGMLDLGRGMAVLPAEIRKGRRKPAIYTLPPALVELLRLIEAPARDLVFPWDKSPDTYWLHWDRILRHAGLPGGRKSKTHSLRVSHATWRDKLGEDASRALLHSDPATTRKHYIDASFSPESNPLFVPWQPEPKRVG